MDQMPTEGDGIVIDANCLINASLKHQDRRLHNPQCEPINNFVGICTTHQFTIGYYPSVEGEARANITNRIWDLSDQKNVKYYVTKKYLDVANKNLENLLSSLPQFDDKSDYTEIYSIKQNFKNHIDKLEQDDEYAGKGVPGDVDCAIISSIRKEGWKNPFVLTDDGHFTHFQHHPFIHSEYGVLVIPSNELQNRLTYSNWPN